MPTYDEYYRRMYDPLAQAANAAYSQAVAPARSQLGVTANVSGITDPLERIRARTAASQQAAKQYLAATSQASAAKQQQLAQASQTAQSQAETRMVGDAQSSAVARGVSLPSGFNNAADINAYAAKQAALNQYTQQELVRAAQLGVNPSQLSYNNDPYQLRAQVDASLRAQEQARQEQARYESQKRAYMAEIAKARALGYDTTGLEFEMNVSDPRNVRDFYTLRNQATVPLAQAAGYGADVPGFLSNNYNQRANESFSGTAINLQREKQARDAALYEQTRRMNELEARQREANITATNLANQQAQGQLGINQGFVNEALQKTIDQINAKYAELGRVGSPEYQQEIALAQQRAGAASQGQEYRNPYLYFDR